MSKNFYPGMILLVAALGISGCVSTSELCENGGTCVQSPPSSHQRAARSTERSDDQTTNAKGMTEITTSSRNYSDGSSGSAEGSPSTPAPAPAPVVAPTVAEPSAPAAAEPTSAPASETQARPARGNREAEAERGRPETPGANRNAAAGAAGDQGRGHDRGAAPRGNGKGRG